MKMYKGQISLELIILILAVVLGAIIVGVVLLDDLVNITSVEDTKEAVLKGFAEE